MSYPQDTTTPPLPVAEMATLAGLLRGGKLNTAEDVRCALAVVCYGASVALPAQTQAARAPTLLTRDSAAIMLDQAAKYVKGGQPQAMQAAQAIPWAAIIKILMPLIEAALPLVFGA